MRRRQAIRFVLASLALLTAVGSASAQIPDRVDHEKYLRIHGEQKKVSDDARRVSNDRLSELNTRRADRVRLEDEKARVERDIAANQSDIERLERRNANLDILIQGLRTRVTENERRAESLRGLIASLDNEIAATGAQKTNQETVIARLERDRENAEMALSEASRRFQEASRALDVASRDRAAGEAEMARLGRELEGLHAEVSAIEEDLRANKSESDALRADNTRLLAEVSEHTRERQTSNQQARELDKGIAALETQLVAMDGQMEDLERRIAELRDADEVILAENPEATPNPEIETLERELADLREMRVGMDSQIDQLRVDRETLGNRIAELTRLIAEKNGTVDGNKQSLEQLKLMADALRKRRADINENAIPRTEGQLTAAGNALSQLTRRESEARRVVETRRIAQDEASSRLAAVDNDIRRETDTLNGIEMAINALEQRRNETGIEIERLADENDGHERSIEDARAEINSNRAGIDGLKRQNVQLRDIVIQMTGAINVALGVEREAESVFQGADTIARDEESRTAAAWSKYQGVLAQYKKELADATNLGRTHGRDPGAREGMDRGTADGEVAAIGAGESDGRTIGERDARKRDYDAGFAAAKPRGVVDGKARGTADGDAAGFTDGRAEGYKSGLAKGFENGRVAGFDEAYPEGFNIGDNEDNRARGFTAGDANGASRAKEVARVEDYPRGVAEIESAVFASAPAQKITIDNAATVTPTVTPVLTPKVTRMAFAAASWDAATRETAPRAAAGSTPTITPPSPDFRFRSYAATFDHVDFTAAYRNNYDSAYAESFRASFTSAFRARFDVVYAARFRAEYDRVFALSFEDSRKSGDADGFRAGFNEAYTPARAAAYKQAKVRGFADGEAAGLPVRFDEGFAKGREEGLAKGESDGAKDAFNEGFADGDAKAFEERLPGERVAAFERGRQDTLDAFARGFRSKALSVRLLDASGDRKFSAGEKFTIEATVRNFGAQPVPQGKLSIKVTDLTGSLNMGTTTGILRTLPGKTEAVFLNALSGTIIGSQTETRLKARIQLFEETREIGSFEVDGELGSFVLVTGFNSNIAVGSPGTLWMGRVFVKNASNTAMANGFKLKVTSRDPRIRISQDWITIPRVTPAQTLTVEFYLSCTQYGDFKGNVFDVQLKDPAGVVVFTSPFNVPIANSR